MRKLPKIDKDVVRLVILNGVRNAPRLIRYENGKIRWPRIGGVIAIVVLCSYLNCNSDMTDSAVGAMLEEGFGASTEFSTGGPQDFPE